MRGCEMQGVSFNINISLHIVRLPLAHCQCSMLIAGGGWLGVF